MHIESCVDGEYSQCALVVGLIDDGKNLDDLEEDRLSNYLKSKSAESKNTFRKDDLETLFDAQPAM